eukprot:5767415-Pyramimonas_sp.AAC.1
MQLLARSTEAFAAEREALQTLVRGPRNAFTDQIMTSLTGLGFAIQARGLCSAGPAAMCRVALASGAFHTCCNLMEEEGGCRESLLAMRSPEMFH